MDKIVRADRGKRARGTVYLPAGSTLTDRVRAGGGEGGKYGSDDDFVGAFEAFPGWAEENLWIETVEGGLVRFKLNFAQMSIHEEVIRLARAGKPVWLVIPKARQEGVSTYAQGLEFYLTTLFDHLTGAVVAHQDTAVRNILRKTQTFYKRLPEDKRRKTEYSNAAQLVYEEPHGSRIIIGVCGSAEAMGQSYTIHIAHLSELALWGKRLRRPVVAWNAFMGAVPKHRRSVVIVESSPQGRDEMLYPLVQSSLSAESDFTVVFLPWYINPLYVRATGGSFERTEEEQSLAREVLASEGRFGGWELTDEQLAWRRAKITSDYQGDVQAFRQYFPTFLSDCFAVVERAFFAPEIIEAYRKACEDETQEPKEVGSIYRDNDGFVQFEASPTGPLTVYRRPVPDGEYVIAADTAEGLPGRDYTHAVVINSRTLEEVAHVHCRIPLVEQAALFAMLGSWYNWATLAPERNYGTTLAYDLWHNHEYPNLHWMYDPERPSAKLTAPGWVTNRRTRPMMLEKLRDAVRERLLKVHDPQFAEEMATFVYDERARHWAAAPGRHDDRVMAFAIACMLVDMEPARAIAQQAKPRPDGTAWFRDLRAQFSPTGRDGMRMRLGRSELWPTRTK